MARWNGFASVLHEWAAMRRYLVRRKSGAKARLLVPEFILIEMNIFMIFYRKWSETHTDTAPTTIFSHEIWKFSDLWTRNCSRAPKGIEVKTQSPNKSKRTLNNVMVPDRMEPSRTLHCYWIVSFSPQRKELSFPLLLAFVLLLCGLIATNQIV